MKTNFATVYEIYKPNSDDPHDEHVCDVPIRHQIGDEVFIDGLPHSVEIVVYGFMTSANQLTQTVKLYPAY